MEGKQSEVFERLGAQGLTCVLDDVLDKTRLARLATACGLKYPGVRIRSVERGRLLSDLVRQADEEAATRETVLRTLERETRTAYRRWSSLPQEEKAERLGDDDFLRGKGNLGLHIYFLARGGHEQDGFETLARRHLLRVMSNGQGGGVTSRPSRAEGRLKKRVTELEKKVNHLEGQLLRGRDAERRLKSDLIQRKGDLAETRMLAERLRRELAEARATASAAVAREAAAPAAEGVEKLARSLRKLSSGQKKLFHGVEKMAQAGRPAPARDNRKALAGLTGTVEKLRGELEALRGENTRARAAQTKRLDELRNALEGKARPKRTTKRSATKTEARVGVFIDVQNVYYAARRLKGKLDFDALLREAVRGRRLIQSSAYVVESKEIDQSGFIGMLEKRAIEVHRKRLRVRADGSKKGDWDMELALDILDEAPDLDVVVLVSGDGDFTSLVQRVKRMGPRVEVVGFPRNTAKSLIEAADEFRPLDRKFMIQPTHDKRPGTKPEA